MNDILITLAVLSAITGLSAIMVFIPLRYWIYGLILCVPFDMGGSIGFLPRLSVVDYFCAAGLVALLARYRPNVLFKHVIDIFHRPHLFLWVLFLIYSAGMAFMLHGSLKGMLRWGEFLFGYFMAALVVSEEDVTVGVAALLSLMGCVMATWALVQWRHSGGDYEKTFAIFNQHNGCGAFLSLCLPAAWSMVLAKKWNVSRLGWVLSALIITAAFLATYSRGAWLGILGGIGIVSLMYALRLELSVKSIAISLFLIVMGAAVPVSWVIYREYKGLPVIVETLATHNQSSRFFKTSQRINYWKASAEIFRAHPWVGLGPKNYDRLIADYLAPSARDLYDTDMRYKHWNDFWQHLHNIYLQILIEYGSMGFMIWALAFSFLSSPLFRAIPFHPRHFYIAFQTSAIAFLLHNYVDILFVNSFDLLFVVLIALCQRPPRPWPA